MLQNSWKDSLESTCATMVPFMFVMSLRTNTHTHTNRPQINFKTAALVGHLSRSQNMWDPLFTHGAALLGGGFVREGRQAACGAEEVCGAFTLVGCLAFFQRLFTVSTGHLKSSNTFNVLIKQSAIREIPESLKRKKMAAQD